MTTSECTWDWQSYYIDDGKGGSEPLYTPFIGVMGVFNAITFSALGACYGTARSGASIAAVGVFKPEVVMKSIIPVVMAGIIAIYGLVVAILIITNIGPPQSTRSTKAYCTWARGVTVGWAGLAAGYAIGVVGDAGVRYTLLQPRLFITMILILIFAEVLGLYGLILAVFMYASSGST